MSVRDEILERLERLPDVPTYADAFDQLRPLYDRDVAPIIAQYGEPPRPQGQWRRDITGEAEGEEQKFVRTSKCELLDVMFLLPADATPAVTVDEAMYKLVQSYIVDKASQQIAFEKGIHREEVRQLIAGWRQ